MTDRGRGGGKYLLNLDGESTVFQGCGIYCHGFENLQYLFANMFLITPERSEIPLCIVLCHHNLIQVFLANIQTFRNQEIP